ncbi:MAG: CPBP family glutamic-type intramembrane protease [Terracidiphilus sp.]
MEPNAATQPKQIPADSAGSKRKAAIEIAVAYLLILAVIWAPRPVQRYLWIAAVMGIVVILWRSFDGWKAMGFTTANLGRSLWIVAVALGLAAAAILVALRIHTLLLPAGAIDFVEGYLAYAVWTGVQQFLLQGFFLLRLLRVTPKGWVAALAAAVLFAAAHLPNPVLTPITLVWGFVACMLFLRYRNIYPLMVVHAILGITVALTVPGPVDHNMRVGLGYLTYNRWAHRHQLHRPVAPELRLDPGPTPGSAQP